jgi:hypothetical protein
MARSSFAAIRKAQMSRTTRILFTFIGLLAVTLFTMNIRAEARQAARIDTLVLRTVSSYTERKLSIYLASSRARLMVFGTGVEQEDGAPPTARTRIVERAVPFSEIQELRRLAAAADLFGGDTAGGDFDLAYRVIEAHGRSHVNITVVTRNSSFEKPGPRKALFDRLVAEEDRLLGKK